MLKARRGTAESGDKPLGVCHYVTQSFDTIWISAVLTAVGAKNMSNKCFILHICIYLFWITLKIHPGFTDIIKFNTGIICSIIKLNTFHQKKYKIHLLHINAKQIKSVKLQKCLYMSDDDKPLSKVVKEPSHALTWCSTHGESL